MVDNIAFKKLHEDVRGSIYTIFYHDRNYEVIEMVRNSLRGGHYHTSDAFLVILDGRIKYEEVNPSIPNSQRILCLGRGDSYVIRNGFVHLITAQDDSLVLEYRESRETINYAPLRERVEKYLQENKDRHS